MHEPRTDQRMRDERSTVHAAFDRRPGMRSSSCLRPRSSSRAAGRSSAFRQDRPSASRRWPHEMWRYFQAGMVRRGRRYGVSRARRTASARPRVTWALPTTSSGRTQDEILQVFGLDDRRTDRAAGVVRHRRHGRRDRRTRCCPRRSRGSNADAATRERGKPNVRAIQVVLRGT